MPTVAPQLGIAAQAVRSLSMPREALRAGLAVEVVAATEAARVK